MTASQRLGRLFTQTLTRPQSAESRVYEDIVRRYEAETGWASEQIRILDLEGKQK